MSVCSTCSDSKETPRDQNHRRKDEKGKRKGEGSKGGWKDTTHMRHQAMVRSMSSCWTFDFFVAGGGASQTDRRLQSTGIEDLTLDSRTITQLWKEEEDWWKGCEWEKIEGSRMPRAQSDGDCQRLLAPSYW